MVYFITFIFLFSGDDWNEESHVGDVVVDGDNGVSEEAGEEGRELSHSGNTTSQKLCLPLIRIDRFQFKSEYSGSCTLFRP